MMSIDKFGRTIKSGTEHNEWDINKTRSPIPLTDDGDYDMQGRKVCNVSLPVGDTDCANKAYVDNEFQKTNLKTTATSNFVSNLTKEVTNHFQTLATQIELNRQTIKNLRTSYDAQINRHDRKIDSNLDSIEQLKREILNGELLLIGRIETLEAKLFGAPSQVP